jgi:RNA-directed DNA polymerase
MEDAIGVQYNCRGEIFGKRAVVRYADDFVCFCETKEDAEQVQSILMEWLKQRGLTLSPEKTRIVHLTEGFNFLGFNVRHYRAPQTARSGWKLLIKPSKEAVHKIRDTLRDLWKSAQGASIQTTLATINPVIRGWAAYFRTVVAKEIFGRLDRWMFYKATRYTKHRHPNKSKAWQRRHYWGRFNLDRKDYSTFGDKQTGRYLLKFSWFPIQRHVMVKGTSSPDDPHLSDYWKKRQAAKACDLPSSKQKLAKRQHGRCLECFESLFNGEELQVHHRIPLSLGGNNRYRNLVLVHLLCHQQIHAKTERTMDECEKDNHREAPANSSSVTSRSPLKKKKEPCCS